MNPPRLYSKVAVAVLKKAVKLVLFQSASLGAEMNHGFNNARAIPLTSVSRWTSLPAPIAWRNYTLAEDVTVSVRADVAPWRLKQIRRYLNELAAGLGAKEENK